MKKVLFFFLLAILMISCSSSEDEKEVFKNNLTVELSDIKGTWYVTKSTDAQWNRIALVLDDHKSCAWSQRDGEYVGPYYFLENVSDQALKEQCALLCIDEKDANRIHIGKIHISKFASEESNYKETYKSQLEITCDLLNYLPSQNSVAYIENKVDHGAWWFWIDSDFSYSFEITKYSPNQMTLRLVDSSYRFADHESRYPLRTYKGTELTLERVMHD